MADEDEDFPQNFHAGGEVDLSDETQDYRFLNHLQFTGADLPKIPKRGEKDFEPHATDLQASILDASRTAMHTTLSIPRIHPPKTHILATYDPATNMAWVHKAKGTHFTSIGKNVQGKEWLLPEEALFLLERGSLDVRWPASESTGDGVSESEALGVPMSLQGAYAAFIGQESSVGGKLTLEMYTVYSSLKRLGYTVLRAEDWDKPRGALDRGSRLTHAAGINGHRWGFQLWTTFWDRLVSLIPPHSAAQLCRGPLVAPGLYRSYNDIYRLLNIIPTHDQNLPPSFALPADAENPFRITYRIYKPSSSFKKSNPGIPDYQIAVINARETAVPTAGQLNDLLATTKYEPPKENGQLYQKIKNGHRNTILAVVDQGIASYIRVSDAGFGSEKLYVRKGRAEGNKRGRGGFRGGSRRGRGRGR